MLTPAPGTARADAIGLVVCAMDSAEPIVFDSHLGDDDVFVRGSMSGGTLFIVPGIWTSMPPPLLAAMRARRACSTTGRCPSCGECVTLATGRLAHEPDCVVADPNLIPVLRKWRRRVGRYARGQRIQEIPGAAS